MAKNLKAWIGRLALLALGLIFLVAGGLKAADPVRFNETISGYGVLPESLSPVVTYILVPLEVALGVALLIDYRRRLALGGAVALLTGFLGLMVYTWASGGDVSKCGCFGELVNRTPGEAILEDLLFIAVGLLGLLAPPRSEEGSRLRAGVAVASALATLAFIPVAPALPLDSLPGVTRLHPGVALKDLGLSLPDAAFSEGRYLVALLALQEEESAAAADALNAIAAIPGAPEVAVIHCEEPEVVDAFFWTHAPAYPMYEVLPEEMRGLYRRLPRFFLMEGGVVQEIWESVPTEGALIATAADHEEGQSS